MQAPNSWKPTLVIYNEPLGKELGLESGLAPEKLAAYFGASEFMDGSTPVAMAYAGQQFGHFVPQLGDGRAVLLGEILTPAGKRFDLHLKGSGPTIYSRRGDGLSALGPALREYIVSEAMHALGVPTTRSLAVVRTGELVQREQLTPGGVLARVARSHLRVGTFQYFAGRSDLEGLRTLADYTIARLYPHLVNHEDRFFLFWQEVARKQMSLIAQWMSLGFIHGVMNTDNMNVSGETIDYGPCAFMDEFRFNKVFSSIDRQGRYAYNQQGNIGLWNLARLAECLMLLMGDAPEVNGPRFSAGLSELQERHQAEFFRRMSAKLGLITPAPGLVQRWLALLEQHELDFTSSFIELERGSEFPTEFSEWMAEWRALGPDQSLMRLTNPLVVPRNHLIERAIEAANRGDDSNFVRLVKAVQDPFNREAAAEFVTPPAVHERVARTFCGT